ncbi:hypothetical protein PDN57_28480 [Bacillus cereus]|uniref:hypothetical protein n=1 Tax=Bacillus thuringiensis TaxID=1428 RepID=UPI0037C5C21A|nr:hypothetical protein [Bacillus cereus]MDA2225458.1 hypothetical protein [Bacillus cereus]
MDRVKEFIIGFVILSGTIMGLFFIGYVAVKILEFIAPIFQIVISSDLFKVTVVVIVCLVLIVCIYNMFKSFFMLCLCIGEEMRSWFKKRVKENKNSTK